MRETVKIILSEAGDRKSWRRRIAGQLATRINRKAIPNVVPSSDCKPIISTRIVMLVDVIGMNKTNCRT
ncbi:MAG: hypothetical protein MW690_000226 [Methanophagales archaeon]|nr:hypothetical protein [Methanophagales archaeon]MCU4140295.1 hypothetical protein [Methanophagales archaeon]